jgi:hypothetical protein
VFYYGEDIYLDSLIILNPLWITKAIYCIFDDEAVSKKNGLISTIEIKRVWGDRLFIDHSAQLISIMRKFNICYEIEAGKSYLIPQLIKDKKIDSNLTSDFDFIVSYDYKFMPKGIISILINNLYEYIDGNNYSKDRILFARDANTILLEEKYYDRQINCYIQGTNYLPLFFLIRDTISKLKNQFPNIEFTEKISCQCFECKRARSIINTGFFEVDFLRRKTNNGANFVDCQKSAESVEISGMLGLFDFLSPNRHTKASFCELVVGKVLGEIFPPTDIKRGFQFKENGWEYDFVIIDKKNKEYVIIEVKAQNSKNPIEVGSDSKEQGTLRWFFESKFPYIEKRILSSQHPMFEGYVFKASYFSLSGFTGDSVSYFASHDKLTPSRLELFYDRTKMEHLLTTNNMGQEKKELKRFT